MNRGTQKHIIGAQIFGDIALVPKNSTQRLGRSWIRVFPGASISRTAASERALYPDYDTGQFMGIPFTQNNLSFQTAEILATAYANGTWLASASASIFTSTDAINWSAALTLTSEPYSFVFGNNLWVAAGFNGSIKTSTDTITWVTQTSNFTTSINAIAYGNGLWAAGAGSGQLRTSTDAITWVTQTSNFGATAIKTIYFGNGLWIAGGEGQTLRTSTDAITWVTRTSPSTTVEKLMHNPDANQWIMGGWFGGMNTSTDGITWTTLTTPLKGLSSSYNIAAIHYSNNFWMAANRLGKIASSTDGINWVTQQSFYTSFINTISYGNGLWLIAGRGGAIKTANPNRLAIPASSQYPYDTFDIYLKTNRLR